SAPRWIPHSSPAGRSLRSAARPTDYPSTIPFQEVPPVRRLRVGLAILAGFLLVPAMAEGAQVIVDAQPVPGKVDPSDVVNKIKRYRMYWGTRATLKGAVMRDDGTPAAGVPVTIVRQIAARPNETIPVATVTSDAEGEFTLQVKPDRI